MDRGSTSTVNKHSLHILLPSSASSHVWVCWCEFTTTTFYMKMKHFIVLYVIIFKYFTLHDNGFLKWPKHATKQHTVNQYRTQLWLIVFISLIHHNRMCHVLVQQKRKCKHFALVKHRFHTVLTVFKWIFAPGTPSAQRRHITACCIQHAQQPY